MKQFKIIDFWINCILITGFTIASIYNGGWTFLIGYVVVGGWQVISMFVHLVTGTFIYKGGSRFVYNWITLISIITMPAGSIYILYFTAPFMAIYYTYQCYNETFVKMQRPLALLK